MDGGIEAGGDAELYLGEHVRGGAEYGADWHNAGRQRRQQTSFDDFIAAAEYLIQSGITTSKKLAAYGPSYGGALVAACLMQRPELFAAVVPAVGLSDLMRFPRFTIGWGWTHDLGDPDDPEDFAVLRQWSPLHNVKENVAYPPLLLLTAANDERAVPMHSYKLAAALQHAAAEPTRILLDVAGGADNRANTDEASRQASYILGFKAQAVGLNVSE